MVNRYFEKFPEVNYNGYNVKNITVAAKLINKYATLPYSYDSYTVNGGERADNVAEEVYDDPYMTWMIYYANKIIDPVYGWYLDDEDFNKFLTKKYGSIPYTFNKIIAFRTNWFEDDRQLSPDQFRAMFGEYTEPHSYYWNPVYNENIGSIAYYIRKDFDNEVNTNKICKIEVNSVDVDNETLIEFYRSGVKVGSGEIVNSDSTHLIFKNVLGDFDVGDIVRIYGSTLTLCTIVATSDAEDFTSDVWTKTNIAPDEYVYWSPYTIHDMEEELNEEKKTLKIVDSGMAIRIANRLEEELNA